MILQPTTVEELQAIVLGNKHLVLRGGGTKSALSTAPDGAISLDMRGFNGIIEYEPGEYTFTAYAGTPLKTIVDTLAKQGQYLPFDPLLVEKGATLGGTVAANTSGSGRWRYGGVRDFILGVRFVDGLGRYVRSGGKVVKNAAGFDLPKFFVGSLGHFGALVEMSFKVFPQPARFMTLQVTYGSLSEAINAIFAVITSPLETDAIDIETYHDKPLMFVRLGGLEAALAGRAERMKAFLQKNSAVEAVETIENDTQFWQSLNNLEWADGYSSLVKVPITPRQLAAFDAIVRVRFDSVKRHYSTAGNVAWVALDDVSGLSQILNDVPFGWSGVQLIGAADLPYVGSLKGRDMLQRVKQVLDPHNVFGGAYYAARNRQE
jgi:glycolate oxidase FAD binding subunit